MFILYRNIDILLQFRKYYFCKKEMAVKNKNNKLGNYWAPVYNRLIEVQSRLAVDSFSWTKPQFMAHC